MTFVGINRIKQLLSLALAGLVLIASVGPVLGQSEESVDEPVIPPAESGDPIADFGLTPPDTVVSLEVSQTTLTVPAQLGDLGSSSTDLTVTVTDANGNPLPGKTVVFGSGNQYWPDRSGGFDDDLEQVTDENGRATITYLADGEEDVVDVHASVVTNPDAPINEQIVQSDTVQLAKDDLATQETPGENSNPLDEPKPTSFLAEGINDFGEDKALSDVLEESLGTGKFTSNMLLSVEQDRNDESKYNMEVKLTGSYSEKELRDEAGKLVAGRTSSSPADLGSMRLAFRIAASDGVEDVASLGPTGSFSYYEQGGKLITPINQTSTQTVEPQEGDTSGLTTIYRNRLGETTEKESLILNPDVAGERDITVEAYWLSLTTTACGASTSEETSDTSAQLPTDNPWAGYETVSDLPGTGQTAGCVYVVDKKDFTVTQKNQMPSEARLDVSVDKTEVSGGGQEVFIEGSLLASVYERGEGGEMVAGEFQPATGSVQFSVKTSVAGGAGTFAQPSVTVGDDGRFSVRYTTPSDKPDRASLRTITISAEALATGQDDEGKEVELGTATGSVVVTQNFDEEAEAEEDNTRLVIGSDTDGVRTLTIYADRSDVAAPGYIEPRKSQCFSAINTCREFGTKISELAAGSYNGRYILLTAELTQNSDGSQIREGQVRGLVTQDPSGITSLLATQNANEGYFGSGRTGVDASLIANPYFYYSTTTEKYGTFTPTDQTKSSLVFNYSYANNRGQPTVLSAQADIGLVSFEQSQKPPNDARIKIEAKAPGSFNPQACETNPDTCGLGPDYQELLAKLKTGQLNEDERKLLQQSVAWLVTVTVSPSGSKKPTGSVALTGQAVGVGALGGNSNSGEFFAYEDLSPERFREYDFNNDPNKPPFAPQPLIAPPPDGFKGISQSILQGSGSAQLDGNGVARAWYIPAQSPALITTKVKALYAEGGGSFQNEETLYDIPARPSPGPEPSGKYDSGSQENDNGLLVLTLTATPPTIASNQNRKIRLEAKLSPGAKVDQVQQLQKNGIPLGIRIIDQNTNKTAATNDFGTFRVNGKTSYSYEVKNFPFSRDIVYRSGTVGKSKILLEAGALFNAGKVPILGIADQRVRLELTPDQAAPSDETVEEDQGKAGEGETGVSDNGKVAISITTDQVDKTLQPNGSATLTVSVTPSPDVKFQGELKLTVRVDSGRGNLNNSGQPYTANLSASAGSETPVTYTAFEDVKPVLINATVSWKEEGASNNSSQAVKLRLFKFCQPGATEKDSESLGCKLADSTPPDDGGENPGGGDEEPEQPEEPEEPAGFQYNPDQPLDSSFNYAREINQANQTFQNSSWLSTDAKQEIATEMNLLSSNPRANRSIITGNVREGLGGGYPLGDSQEATALAQNSQTDSGGRLVDAMADIVIAQLREQVRQSSDTSEIQKRQFDQTLAYFKQTRDVSALDDLGRVSYVWGTYVGQIKGIYTFYRKPLAGSATSGNNSSGSGSSNSSGSGSSNGGLTPGGVGSSIGNFISLFTDGADSISGAQAGGSTPEVERVSIWDVFVNWIGRIIHGGTN